MRTPRCSWDLAIGALADRQHGVVAHRQLLDAGLSVSGIRHRVRATRLRRVYPSLPVYAVGTSVLSREGSWMAAVLAGGDGALLSHLSAAALWGLVDGFPPFIDVATSRTPTRTPGLRGHRVASTEGRVRSAHRGIPCTSPSRTLVDLAGVVGPQALDRALRRAADLRVLDAREIQRWRVPGRPGSAAIGEAIAALGLEARADGRTRSALERRFLALLRRHRLSLPSTNVAVDTGWRTYEVDALWRRARLVVELDGWSTHRDRETFRRDHRRDADLGAAGFRVLRLDWDQVVREGDATAERLRLIVPPRAT